jgi:hypothetical protein
MELTDLILMICKNHHGEWLSAKRVRDIVNAIKGTNILLAKIKRGLSKLAKTNKLTRMTGTCGEHYTANCTKGGFYL